MIVHADRQCRRDLDGVVIVSVVSMAHSTRSSGLQHITVWFQLLHFLDCSIDLPTYTYLMTPSSFSGLAGMQAASLKGRDYFHPSNGNMHR
jgi:hypothetical protein